jgi:S1-C subfamily serine protease
MIMRHSKLTALAAMLLISACAPISSSKNNAANIDQLNNVASLISQHGAALVTVSYVLSFDAQGQNQRVQGEVEAPVISADGLILLPSAVLNPAEQYRSIQMSGDFNMPNISSSEFKVRLSGRAAQLDAKVVSKDKDLGIAWLKISDPPADLKFVLLNAKNDPVVGQKIFALDKASEDFDYSPYVVEGLVGGAVKVPFPAFIGGQPSKLAFDMAGNAVGYGVLQMAGNPNLAGQSGMKVFTLLLPVSKVVELTSRINEAKN